MVNEHHGYMKLMFQKKKKRETWGKEGKQVCNKKDKNSIPALKQERQNQQFFFTLVAFLAENKF